MRLRLLSAIATTVALALPASASAGTAVLNYTTPGTYTFKVPAGVTSLSVRANGASGSPAGIPQAPISGGRGGELSGTLAVTPGTVLRIAVDVGGGSGASLGGRGGGYSGVLTSSGGAIAIAPGGGGAGHNLIGESGGGGGDALQAGARGADLYDNLVSAGYVSGAGGGGGAGTAGAGGAGGSAGNRGAAGSAGGLLQGGAAATAGASPADDGSGGGGGGGGYYGGGGGGSTGGITVGGGGGGGGSFFVGALTGSSTSLTTRAASVTLSFLDSTPPSLTLNAPQAVNPTTLTGTAGIEAGDNSTISLDFISASQPTVTVQGSVSQTDGAFSVAVPSLARGAWLVRAVQRDSAGNETRTALRSFNRVDTPTITWPTPDPITYGTALSTTQLSATASVAGTFSYSPALGTVLDAGADQDLKVTFTPDDTGNYAVTTKTVKLTVNKATQVVSFSPPNSVPLNAAPITLTASATSGGPVTFSVISGPCTLDGNVVTIQRANNRFPNTCEIHADQAGTSNYSAATNIALLNIRKLIQTITFPRPPGGRVGDDPVELAASSDSGLPVRLDTYGGSCTLSGTRLTFTSVGLCGIIASQGGDSTYETAGVTFHEIQVTKGTPKITWPTPDPITYGTALSDTQLNATASVDGEFSYSPDLDTVLDAGADQDLKVTFTPDDTTNYEPTTKTVKLTVNKAKQTVDFPLPDGVFLNSAPITLTASATSGGPVTFSLISGPCTLDGNVVTIARANNFFPDTCEIHADQAGTNNYKPATNIGLLYIKKLKQKITFPRPADGRVGDDPVELSASSDAGLPVEFSAGGSCTVSGNRLTFVKVGSCLVYARQGGNSTYDNALIVDHFIDVTKGTPKLTWPAPDPIRYGDALSTTQLNATAPVDGTFSYSPALGTVLNAGADQELEVTFTPADTTNYDPATKTAKLTVNKATTKVKWPTPDPITYGEALSSTQLNASAPIPGTFSYTPDEGTVLGGGADQNLSVRFTPEDTDNYETVEVITSIDVDRAPQEITFAQPADLVAGGEAQALTASASSKLPVAFAVTGPCTVAGGKVSATAAGSCQITATQPGDDNYLAAEPVVRTLTVAPKPVPQAEPVALLGATLGQRCVVGRQRTTTALTLNLRTTGAPKLTFRLDRKRGSRGRVRCPKANANYVAENRWAAASVENAGTGDLVSGTAARATARRAAVASATATATLPANLKPGRYRLTITTTAGTKTTSIPLYLWVLNPNKR